jgi:hypothetical protein
MPPMFEEGASTGDREVIDLRGKARNLREFRRRSHVVLLWDPAAGAAELAAWRERRQAESQRWTWLQSEAVVPAAPPPGLAPGTYLISRWGRVIAIHPPGARDLDRIERDLLTFEAQDCCDLSKSPQERPFPEGRSTAPSSNPVERAARGECSC